MEINLGKRSENVKISLKKEQEKMPLDQTFNSSGSNYRDMDNN